MTPAKGHKPQAGVMLYLNNTPKEFYFRNLLTADIKAGIIK